MTFDASVIFRAEVCGPPLFCFLRVKPIPYE